MQNLVAVDRASQALKVSRGFLYKLPKSTPGVYRLGRTVRICIEELLNAGSLSEPAPLIKQPPVGSALLPDADRRSATHTSRGAA